MTQQNQQRNGGQAGSSRERQSGQGGDTSASQQPGNASQGGEETPEQWLEENSLGDPNETGNTITGENEY